MNNLKTYEEFKWPWSKKEELTPDEEYQRQKRKNEKDWKKVSAKAKKREFNPNDPYGEELAPETEEIVSRQMRAETEYYNRASSNRSSYNNSRSAPRKSRGNSLNKQIPRYVATS